MLHVHGTMRAENEPRHCGTGQDAAASATEPHLKERGKWGGSMNEQGSYRKKQTNKKKQKTNTKHQKQTPKTNTKNKHQKQTPKQNFIIVSKKLIICFKNNKNNFQHFQHPE